MERDEARAVLRRWVQDRIEADGGVKAQVKREMPKPEYKYTVTPGVWMDCGTVVAEGALTSVAQDWNTYVTVVRDSDA